MGMSQEAFCKRHGDLWRDVEESLDRIEAKKVDRPVDDFPDHYRRICRQLAVARSRGYSPAVRQRLEKIVERGHRVLYGKSRRAPLRTIWTYVAGGFARDVRKNWVYLAVATAAFVLPFLAIFAWTIIDPGVAVEVMGPDQVAQFDSMYDVDAGSSRHAGDDLMMFAFYIYNNVGIALRTFGAGAFFGLGSLFIAVFNGLFLGTASGYVTYAGHGEQFWPFVVGHGSFELTAIVLAAMAGFKIGAAPIWPGRRSRVDALRQAAQDSVGIVMGFTVMLIIAAFIEAFWSPRATEPMVRYVVGGGLWALVLGYLAFAGRGHGSR